MYSATAAFWAATATAGSYFNMFSTPSISCPTVCTALAVLRRISFVRALADFFPPFIIADEPTTDLDVVAQGSACGNAETHALHNVHALLIHGIKPPDPDCGF